MMQRTLVSIFSILTIFLIVGTFWTSAIFTIERIENVLAPQNDARRTYGPVGVRNGGTAMLRIDRMRPGHRPGTVLFRHHPDDNSIHVVYESDAPDVAVLLAIHNQRNDDILLVYITRNREKTFQIPSGWEGASGLQVYGVDGRGAPSWAPELADRGHFFPAAAPSTPPQGEEN